MGLVLPGPPRPPPRTLLPRGVRERHPRARARRGAPPVPLDQVQQPARAPEGRRHRGRKRHLHRLRADQHRRAPRERRGRRERGHLPHPRRRRGDASPPAELVDTGEPEESRPVRRARGPDHPHGLRTALGLQRRSHRRGARATGQIDRRRAERRLERLRRGRRLRQGELQPHRLFQHAEGPRDSALRRRRSADGEPHRLDVRRSARLPEP